MSNSTQSAGGDIVTTVGIIERRELAATLRAEGLSLRAIGKRLGVSAERARQLLLPLRGPKDCRTCGRTIPHNGSYCQLACRPSYYQPTGKARGRPRLGDEVPVQPITAMSRPARATRRRRIAQLAREGKTLIEIQNSELVSIGTIRIACKEAGITCPSVGGDRHGPRTESSARPRAKLSSRGAKRRTRKEPMR